MWTLQQITPPSAEPLDRDSEVRAQLRLSVQEAGDQAALLDVYIKAARTACEDYTQRQLIEAVWELWLESWFEPGIYRCEDGVDRLRLPKPPATVLTSIKYTDSLGVEQTWAASNYALRAPTGAQAQRGEIYLAVGASWPTDAALAPGAIRIRFTAGYGTAASSVPDALRAGMLLRVSEFYERRAEATQGTIQGQNQQVAEVLWSNFRAF